MRLIQNKKAFTLIEVIIALSLFAIVLLLLMGGLSSGLEVLKRDNEASVYNDEYYLFIRKLQRELENAIPFSVLPFQGSEEDLKITTVIDKFGDDGRKKEVLQIHYWKEGDTIYRNEDSAADLLKEGKVFSKDLHKQVWLEGIKKISFEYASKGIVDASNWSGSWLNEKDASRLPMGVKMEIEFKQPIGGIEKIEKIFFLPAAGGSHNNLQIVKTPEARLPPV